MHFSAFLCHALFGRPGTRARRLTAQGGERRTREVSLINIFPHTTFPGPYNTNLNTAPHDFPGPYAHERYVVSAGPAMPSFWSFFGFVGSLHLSSARRVVIFCSPFAVHLASFVWCFPSGAYRGRRDATGACALSQTYGEIWHRAQTWRGASGRPRTTVRILSRRPKAS